MRYNIDKNGKVFVFGSLSYLPYEVNSETPFNTLAEAYKFKLINNKWVKDDKK